jgi:hypothetical protein
MHELTPRLSLSASWVYNTGNAYSLPEGRFTIQDVPGLPFRTIPIYPELRNTERLAHYHRLDLGVVWKLSHAGASQT